MISDTREIALDAEWGKDNETLTVQLAEVDGTGALYMNKDLPLPAETIEKCLEWGALHPERGFQFATINDDTNLVEKYLEDSGCLEVNLLMFYSPNDISRALGFNNVEPLYKRGFSKRSEISQSGIKQDRCLRARKVKVGNVTISIHDMKGWTAGGLKNLASSVGVEMQAKSEMDDYKSDMLAGLIADPVKFLDYAWADAVDMHSIKTAFVKSIKEDVALNILGVKLEGDLPHTTGSIVSKTAITWLHGLPEKKNAFEYATRKLGILDPSHKKHRDAVNVLAICRDVYKTCDDVEGSPKYLKFLDERCFRALGYSQCSVKELARQPSTAAFSALVQGGRCNNEHPLAYSLGIGADIDLKSCYGNSLISFTYPLGLPSLWGNTENQKSITLKEWLKETNGQRVPGLWTATVSGTLSFSQDLLFSKLTTLEQIKRSLNDGFDESADAEAERDNPSHIPGQFCLTHKQVVNAIITDDIWEALTNISTNLEMTELLNLDLVCASAYLTKNEVKGTIDDWSEVVIQDRGEYRTEPGNAANIIDDRTRAWFGVPIADFIKPLVDKRNEIKTLLKNDPSLKPLDTAMKLFINTLYGVLCSPHFLIGNTVVANNITARARLGTYMMNKALWTVQSITDGGIYSPVLVPYLTVGRKPGLDVLSDRTNWIERRRPNRTLKPLKGQNWDDLIKPGMSTDEVKVLGDNLDIWALEHVNTFWSNYGLVLPFKIEHKPENTFTKAAYWSKGHYALLRALHPDEKYDPVKYAVRGAKLHKTDELRQSPMFELLDNILEGSDVFPRNFLYDHTYLLKLKMWNVFQASNGYEANKVYRPGDFIVQERLAHFNNTHMRSDESQEYVTRAGRVTRRTVKGEAVNVELFEKFCETGISGVHLMMTRNNLRKKG